MGKRKITSDSCNNFLTLMGNLEIVIMNRADFCKRQMESLEQKSNQFSSEAMKISTGNDSLFSLITQQCGRLSARLEQLDLQMSTKIANHVEEDNVEMCNIKKEMNNVRMVLDHFALFEQLTIKMNRQFECDAQGESIGLKSEFINLQRKKVDDVIHCVHSTPLISSCSNLSPDLFDAFFTQFGFLERVIKMLEKFNRQMDLDLKMLSDHLSSRLEICGMIVDFTTSEDFPKF